MAPGPPYDWSVDSCQARQVHDLQIEVKIAINHVSEDEIMSIDLGGWKK
jgi:hypothetical protein